MKRLLPLAGLAAALTAPQIADATTYCVSKPECVSAGGIQVQDLQTALGAAEFPDPAPNRVGTGAADFSLAGGFTFDTKAGEGVDIVGSGRGFTRPLNPSTANAASTLKLGGQRESSVSDLSIVAPTPSGNPGVAWGLATSATVRRVDVSGVSNYIAVQLNYGGKIEESTIHGVAAYAAIGTSGGASISDSSIETAGEPIGASGTLRVTRTRIDAHSGPRVAGNGALTITDSLILTHGGPGLWTSVGGNTTLHATGDTVVGDGSGSAGLMAGEGGASHHTHVTVANTILTGYGHSIIANQAGGSVDVKLSHSAFDVSTVVATAGQVDTTDANLHVPAGFGAPYHLAPDSPLVDAGDPVAASQSDLEGAARSLDGNGDGTATPDIGAFELPAPPPPPPTPTPTPTTPPADPG